MNPGDLKGDILIAELIVKFMKNEITADEELVLQNWLAQDERNRDLFNELTSGQIEKELQALPRYDIEKAESRVLASIKERKTLPWVRYAVPAAAALLIYFGLYHFMDEKKPAPEQVAATTRAGTLSDIPAPASVNAVLMLADGRTLILDSLHKGETAGAASAHIKKLSDGQYVYSAGSSVSQEVKYNTLTVPSGSKIVNFTLADGTHVTLNAASSITFPTRFVGSERRIAITGEGYFEVAHDKTRPFIVEKGDAEIEVLGTHFNVNAYDNEQSINVTLVEGSVRVSLKTAAQTRVLKPGQMAMLSGKVDLVNNVNLAEVLAWKEGKFRFGESASIESVMRQISRWYDVEVEYKGTINGHIGGSIERESNVSQVLQILEMTGVVKFQIEGRKIIVIPR